MVARVDPGLRAEDEGGDSGSRSWVERRGEGGFVVDLDRARAAVGGFGLGARHVHPERATEPSFGSPQEAAHARVQAVRSDDEVETTWDGRAERHVNVFGPRVEESDLVVEDELHLSRAGLQ